MFSQLGTTPPTDGTNNDGTNNDGTNNDGTNNDGTNNDGSNDDGDPNIPDSSDPVDNNCATETKESTLVTRPSDIIFIVDNSGSMTKEVRWVQENMNRFSSQISDSGIGLRVILLSDYPSGGNEICIDPPLGGDGCPKDDNNLPQFRHVNIHVDSNDGLVVFLSFYALWSNSLCPEAAKHIFIVSDDNMLLPAFGFDMGLDLYGDMFAGYKFHGIFCFTDCSSAANVGWLYRTLVNNTNGVSGDLCEQDFDPVFDALATDVVEESKITCKIEMPEPPENKLIDPNQVSVKLLDSARYEETLKQVVDASQCSNGDWYYDDNNSPTHIILCPNRCNQIQDLTDAKLTINLGCLLPT